MLWKNDYYSSGLIKKRWGSLKKFGSPWGVYGKILNIESGCSTSFKYYTSKDELMCCITGNVLIYSPNSDEFTEIQNNENKTIIRLGPGESICIERNTPYKIVAIEDSQLVELVYGSRRDEEKPIKYEESK